MSPYSKDTGIYAHIILILVFVNALVFKMAFLKDKQWYGILIVTVLLLLITVLRQKTTRRRVKPLRKRLPEEEAII